MMRRFRTLRVRFALWTSGLLLVALLAFGGYVYFSMRQGLVVALDESLQVSANQAIAGISGENLNVENGLVTLADNLIEGAATSQLHEREFTIRVLVSAYKFRQAVGPYRDLTIDTATISAMQAGMPHYATLTDPSSGEPVRIYSVRVQADESQTSYVQVAISYEPVEDMLRQLLRTLLIGVPLLVLLAGAGGYWLAARALAPIDQITSIAQRISAQDLHARLGLPPIGDEVVGIAIEHAPRLFNRFYRVDPARSNGSA